MAGAARDADKKSPLSGSSDVNEGLTSKLPSTASELSLPHVSPTPPPPSISQESQQLSNTSTPSDAIKSSAGNPQNAVINGVAKNIASTIEVATCPPGVGGVGSDNTTATASSSDFTTSHVPDMVRFGCLIS